MRIAVTSFHSITEKIALLHLYQVVQENHAYHCTLVHSTTKSSELLQLQQAVKQIQAYCCNLAQQYNTGMGIASASSKKCEKVMRNAAPKHSQPT